MVVPTCILFPMKHILVLSALCTIFFSAFAQDDPKTSLGKLGPNPMFLIDSQKVTRSALSAYMPEMIATVTVLYDTSAIRLYGDSAKDGAVIIETRDFARRLFVAFFRKVSPAYDSLYNVYGNDSSFAYIVNDNVQNDNYEGNLSAINSEIYEGLEILSAQEIAARFKITHKQLGVLVRSKKPKDLYNADKKF
jgi:hypothetical protein